MPTDHTEDGRKLPVTLHLAPDVVAALEASGPDWNERVEALIRAHLAGTGAPATNGPATNGIVGLLPGIARHVAGRMMRNAAGRITREMAQAANEAARRSLAATDRAKRGPPPEESDPKRR